MNYINDKEDNGLTISKVSERQRFAKFVSQKSEVGEVGPPSRFVSLLGEDPTYGLCLGIIVEEVTYLFVQTTNTLFFAEERLIGNVDLQASI